MPHSRLCLSELDQAVRGEHGTCISLGRHSLQESQRPPFQKKRPIEALGRDVGEVADCLVRNVGRNGREAPQGYGLKW